MIFTSAPAFINSSITSLSVHQDVTWRGVLSSYNNMHMHTNMHIVESFTDKTDISAIVIHRLHCIDAACMVVNFMLTSHVIPSWGMELAMYYSS